MKTSIPVTPENDEPDSYRAYSPLSPFKTRLRLLQFLGWPLKISNDESTEVKKRPCSIMVLICYLATMLSLTAVSMVAFTYVSFSEFRALMYEQNIKKWEQNSLTLLTVPNMLFAPNMFYYFYSGLDLKMTSFLKTYSQAAEILQGKVIIRSEVCNGPTFIADNAYNIFKRLYWKVIIIYCMDILVAILFVSYFVLLHTNHFPTYIVVVAAVAAILIDLVIYFPFITSSG